MHKHITGSYLSILQMEVLWTTTCTKMRIEWCSPIIIQMTLRPAHSLSQLYTKDRKKFGIMEYIRRSNIWKKYVLHVATWKEPEKKNKNNFLQTKMQRHHSFCFSLSRRSKCLYMSSVRACRPLNLMRPRERIEKATDHAAETTRWHAVMKLCHLLTENKAVPFLCHPPRLSLLYPQCLCSL